MAFNITEFSNKWVNFKEELKGYLNNALNKNGDTMKGKLILSASPTENMEATTKNYVDSLHKFIPGNRFLKSCRVGDTATKDILRVGSIKGYSQTWSTSFCPSADGALSLSGVIRLSSNSIPYWYSNVNSVFKQDISTDYDVKISASLKYSYGDVEEIVVWSQSDISLSEEFALTGIGLKDGVKMLTEIPVIKGKAASLTLSLTVDDCNERVGDRMGTGSLRNMSHMYADIRLGMGNPSFDLDYTEV